MNNRTQVRTIINALRQKHAAAKTKLNRKKIRFVANTIKALLDE